MNKFYFGSHINISYGIDNAIEIKKYNGNLIQIFITNLKSNDIKLIRDKLKENNIKIVVHSSYQHNIGRNWDRYSWWIKSIEQEIEKCYELDALGLVIHFGKQMDLTLEETYNNMYTSLIYIHNKTKKYKNIKILLETSTGQGSEVCFKIEDLAYFFKKFSNSDNKEIRNRFKLCIDTCHIFSAGYDIRSKNSVKLYLETFNELIGIKNIHLIHLNDCKVKLGDFRDRHQNIGKGYIGFVGLKIFFDYFRKLNIPIVLETPNEGYKNEIKLLI